MEYVDGFVVAVPLAKKDEYVKYAREAAVVFRDHGATRLAAQGEMPFDGQRVIYGGFQMVVDA